MTSKNTSTTLAQQFDLIKINIYDLFLHISASISNFEINQMYSIINLITNTLSLLNSKKVQSAIFFVLLFIAIGIFIFISCAFHHSLFSYFFIILVTFLSIILTFFAVFYTKTDDRVIAIVEKLSDKNFKIDEIESRRVINKHLRSNPIPFCKNENFESPVLREAYKSLVVNYNFSKFVKLNE